MSPALRDATDRLLGPGGRPFTAEQAAAIEQREGSLLLAAGAGSGKTSVLVERVGFRIHSRLHEMCEFINMKAIDYRKAGDDTSPETLDRLEKHGRSVANGGLPTRARPARARLREPAARDGKADPKWPGGRAGS